MKNFFDNTFVNPKTGNKSIGAQGFTLMELIIVIFIIGVLSTSIRYVDFNEVNARKRVEVFTSHVGRVFESARNNALFGRSIGTFNPEAWRVSIGLTNSGTIITEYLSGTVWELYDDREFSFTVDFPQFISSINCNATGDVSSGTGIVEFRGRVSSFSGACDLGDKIMTIDTNYGGYTGSLNINSISGVIQTDF